MISNLRTHRSNVYLVEIQGYLAHWAPRDYIQEASLSWCKKRFCVSTRGCSRSIGVKRCKILACGIFYLPKNHNMKKIAEDILRQEKYKELTNLTLICEAMDEFISELDKPRMSEEIIHWKNKLRNEQNELLLLQKQIEVSSQKITLIKDFIESLETIENGE